MKISLTDAGKRFNRDWIFRHFFYEFIAGKSYAITGPNGSGKSTLLQILAGAMVVSEGTVDYTSLPLPVHKRNENGAAIPSDLIYRYISVAAPYLDLVEEMTATEFLQFHTQFKPLLPQKDIKAIISLIGLEAAAKKQIRFYSSGMRQRIKLAQAVFSDVPCILLDEPCTNLDAEGIALYHDLIGEYCQNRLVIVSSNDEVEYQFCRERINLLQYKS